MPRGGLLDNGKAEKPGNVPCHVSAVSRSHTDSGTVPRGDPVPATTLGKLRRWLKAQRVCRALGRRAGRCGTGTARRGREAPRGWRGGAAGPCGAERTPDTPGSSGPPALLNPVTPNRQEPRRSHAPSCAVRPREPRPNGPRTEGRGFGTDRAPRRPGLLEQLHGPHRAPEQQRSSWKTRDQGCANGGRTESLRFVQLAALLCSPRNVRMSDGNTQNSCENVSEQTHTLQAKLTNECSKFVLISTKLQIRKCGSTPCCCVLRKGLLFLGLTPKKFMLKGLKGDGPTASQGGRAERRTDCHGPRGQTHGQTHRHWAVSCPLNSSGASPRTPALSPSLAPGPAGQPVPAHHPAHPATPTCTQRGEPAQPEQHRAGNSPRRPAVGHGAWKPCARGRSPRADGLELCPPSWAERSA